MNNKNIAQSYFDRIASGHGNAVSRPDLHLPGGEAVDRALRNMVEDANHNGDCIINVGHGYYRPVPGDPADEMELKEYISKDDSRAEKLMDKTRSMETTFKNWKKEAAYSEQQKQGRSGRAGACKVS